MKPDLEKIAAVEAKHPVVIETTVADLMPFIGAVQLALRHPLFKGPASEKARGFVLSIQKVLATECPETAKLIEMGFKIAFDVPFVAGTIKSEEQIRRARDVLNQVLEIRQSGDKVEASFSSQMGAWDALCWVLGSSVAGFDKMIDDSEKALEIFKGTE